MTTPKEDKNILDEVVNALLDENTPVLIETTYRTDMKDAYGVPYATELTTTPQIPTEYGKRDMGNVFSSNAYRARSIKIGKISIRKYPNGNGFWIRTPDGKESEYLSRIDYNSKAYCVWVAALSKYDKNKEKMFFFLDKAGYKNLTTHSNPKAPIYNQAINQLKSLGLSEQDMTHIKKLKDKSNNR